jgi:hypothetical protein
MEEFCGRFAEQPGSQDVAGVLDGVYRFVVTPAGPLTEQHIYDVAISPGAAGHDGQLATVVDEPSDVRLTLTADYLRWYQLITGQLDVGMAVMLRRLKVAGDLSPLIGGLSSTKPLMEALGAVDSQWLPE